MESETIISEQFYANGSSAAISEKTLNGSFFRTNEKSQKVHVERPKSKIAGQEYTEICGYAV